MKKAIVFIFIVFALLNCNKDNKTDCPNFIDSFDLSIGGCIKSIEQSTICFDSLITDSRCATGAECCWEGNAATEFNLTTSDNEKFSFVLNTNPEFTVDTTIENIYIALCDLTPYPVIGMSIYPDAYKARLTIANIDLLESNARILNFNSEKCGCCWGWTIEIGNDTINSDDEIIGKIIGYKTGYPVNVYIELGDLERTCSESGLYDYYGIKQIVKIF